MTKDRTSHFTKRLWLFVISSVVLSGCLQEEKESSTKVAVMDNAISGSVGDGPIIGATIRIFRSDGAEIAQLESDSNANYAIDVRTDASLYPLSLHATGGTDIVTNSAPDFDLLGAVFEQSQESVANLNPFSTLAVELARDMPGGENKINLEAAQNIVASEFNHGLASVAASGPMNTSMDGSNISEIVRASEALAETLRRTRNALVSSGFTSSGNDVVQALSSDLTDGVVDGLGAGQTDARYAAVSTIVAAQVLLETMANELHVNGVNATTAMSNAINQVSVDVANPTMDELTTTRDMISRARIGLDAAFAVSNDPLISELHNIVAGISPNTSSQSIKSLILPADYRTRLDNVVMLVAGGSPTIHEVVNDISRNSGSTPTLNTAPSISGIPAISVVAGNVYSFTPSATDAEGDALVFDIANLPGWASFDTSSGEINGIPSSSDAGTDSNIIISVSDGEFSSSLAAFSITVNATPPSNLAPQISGTPPSIVQVGVSYSFTPTASDPDGDPLVFSVSGLPGWANFSSASGQISGTPLAADVGTYNNVFVAVSDGQASSVLPGFSITVEAGSTANTAPVISGTAPTSVTAGNAYSFTPTASDADGDPLVFSVTGLPGWANFSSVTGQISGTPAAADVGTYSNISLAVTDGQDSDQLPQFSISVDPIALGSVTLNWTAPTENTDGSPLTDLAGFNILWGTTAGNYPNSVIINNPSVSTYVVENLQPGTYEFVATSFNSQGMESSYSAPATRTVP